MYFVLLFTIVVFFVFYKYLKNKFLKKGENNDCDKEV